MDAGAPSLPRHRHWSLSVPRSPCRARTCGEARAAPPRRPPRGRISPVAPCDQCSGPPKSGATDLRTRHRAMRAGGAVRGGRNWRVIAAHPPYALAPLSFRFAALATLAARAPIGGQREVALATYVAARLAHDAIP